MRKPPSPVQWLTRLSGLAAGGPGAVLTGDTARQGGVDELRASLRDAVARAVCRNVSGQEIQSILNEVVEEFR